jgi:50S ribosomal subunit-associated GTPase HflX
MPLLRKRFGRGVCLSAATGRGLDTLRDRILMHLDRRSLALEVRMSPAAGRLQAYLTEHGDVVERDYGEEDVRIKVRIGRRHLGAIRRMGGDIGDGVGQEKATWDAKPPAR